MNEETIRQTIANEQNELGNVYKEIDARTITKATNKQTDETTTRNKPMNFTEKNNSYTEEDNGMSCV